MECQECIEQEEMLTEALERIDELTMQLRNYKQISYDQIQATAKERDEAIKRAETAEKQRNQLMKLIESAGCADLSEWCKGWGRMVDCKVKVRQLREEIKKGGE